MLLQPFQILVHEDFEAVNSLINNKIQTENGLVYDLSNHIIQSGGKRLRPLIVLLTSRACGYDGQRHLLLAAMVEFFHTATLLHDDVIDESRLRRGKETAHEIWGSKASILVGDYLFTQYMQLLIEVANLNIMNLMTKIAYQIGCGEIKQLTNRHNFNLSIDDYFDVIRSKTSLLFAASSSIAGLIAEVNHPIEKALYDYGLHLGNAFQLIDDALDYCSDPQVLGKNIGDDLAEGKATLPLLYVLKNGTEDQKTQIRLSLERGSLEFFPEILKAIEETKAIEFTREIAITESKKALAALEILPSSKYKIGLAQLAEYAITRDF